MSGTQQQQKNGAYENKEGNGGGGTHKGIKRSWHSFQSNLGKRKPHNQQGECEVQPSNVQMDDGDVEMRGVQKPQVRYVPYTMQPDKMKMIWCNEGYIDNPLCRSIKHLKREMENTQDKITERWFKITVPNGRKHDKTWLINSIQSHCSVPFTPVDFHYTNHRAQFFVQDANTAYALMDVNYKICDEENRKIAIFVTTSSVPYSLKDKLESEAVEQLKLTMNKRYDVSQKALDLQLLRYDPDLVGNDVVIALNRRNCMTATLQIIEKNFPELLSLNLCKNKLRQLSGLSDITQRAPTVKILNLSKNELTSTWELVKIKDLNLEELWLEGNPFCDTFPDQSTYISAIMKYFPKLLRLDGQDLALPMNVDTDEQHLIRSSKESSTASDEHKGLILQFLQQYYWIYDSGDRRDLLNAYHDEACFSLAISVNPDNPASTSLFEYFKDNRNMKKLKDSNLRFQLLKHTKRDIVCSLCVLPKTSHDISSFVVDLWFMSETMLCFSVSGLFTEVEGRSQGCVRAFTRTFITTSASNSSMFIVNDELFVRVATPKETESVLPTQVPMPFSSSEPTLSQKQQEMVQAFSIQSGMKPQWSEKCLQDNAWNYTRAAEIFTVLKTEGKIPEEAFKRIP